MIKIFCDRCGRELAEGCSNQVNVNFNYYGISGFDPHGSREFQFCPECAGEVHMEMMKQKRKLAVVVSVTKEEAIK